MEAEASEIAAALLRHPDVVRGQLRHAVTVLTSRGLRVSARWAAEMLTALNAKDGVRDLDGPNPSDAELRRNFIQAAALDAQSEAAESKRDRDVTTLGKAFFDMGEYLRAAETLKVKGPYGILKPTPKSIFLRAYALYLAGEKKKQDELMDRMDRGRGKNPYLKELECELRTYYESEKLDGLGLYIYGVVMKELESDLELARGLLRESVQRYPWNWSAWVDLAALCSDKDALHALDLKVQAPWMIDFFHAHLLLDLQHNEEALQLYQALGASIPASTYIISQSGMAHYNMRNFDEAQEEFEILRRVDPYRLDNLDTFSNVLYVKESKAALSHLAHSALLCEKYRPETCCIIGNYYSLKGHHERAVVHFQRALKLNPKFLSAWTLMGHEFVELKNTSAAIEAYRRAVDINPRDYRAWYGLGQTYEILQMFFYALHYYRKATTLRSYDSRMWTAMAGCYERLERRQEAVMCYERAISNHDREGSAAVRLAKIYREMGAKEKAAKFFKYHLECRGNDAADSPESVEAILFLAQFCKESRMYDDAARYCSRLLDHPGPEREEAKALLRELRSLDALE